MPSAIDTKPHYTLSEFAKIIAVSYSTAKRMACEGVIERVQLRSNGRKVIPHTEVQRIRKYLGIVECS